MDRLERLLNLVAALIDTERPLTAEEIATRVPGFPAARTPTFKRAFERDKATLRDMGIPIDIVEVEPGNPETPVGYRVPKDRYELPDPGLEADEVAALHLAATRVRLEGGEASAAVWKLGGVPDALPADGAATAHIPGADHLAGLFTAVSDRRTVTFPYRGTARTVDPWHLESRNGAWYLIGWDHDRAEQRTYRLDRLDGPPESGPAGAFERPAHRGPVATHPWEMGDEEPVEVEVLVDAEQADWASANAGPGEQRPDGSVVLRLRVTNRSGLRSWVLGFLDHAEILAPPDARQDMVTWLEQAVTDAP